MGNHLSSEKHARYFEAIIQLRPAETSLVSYVYSLIEAKSDVSISKIEKLKTGIDIYLSSWRAAVAIGKKLKDRFSGELKLSRALHGINRQTSKEVYRVTVLFRLKNEDL